LWRAALAKTVRLVFFQMGSGLRKRDGAVSLRPLRAKICARRKRKLPTSQAMHDREGTSPSDGGLRCTHQERVCPSRGSFSGKCGLCKVLAAQF